MAKRGFRIHIQVLALILPRYEAWRSRFACLSLVFIIGNRWNHGCMKLESQLVRMHMVDQGKGNQQMALEEQEEEN